MRNLVLDTSVYIPFFRTGQLPGAVLDVSGTLLSLSAVVAQELYAGAGDAHTLRALDDLCEVFARQGRVLVPTTEDWYRCGRTLAQIGRRFGYDVIKKGRLVNDVLIALSCQRADALLITANQKDFQTISKFLAFRFLGV